MSDRFWQTDAQIAGLEPFFPESHGKPLVDYTRVLSEFIYINRNGLQWRDAPAAHGPLKMHYNRWKRRSDKGIFARMMAGRAAKNGEEKTVMINATSLKAQRNAQIWVSKRGRGRLFIARQGNVPQSPEREAEPKAA